MSNIEEMSIEEIINEIGICLGSRDMSLMLNGDEKAIDRMYELMSTKNIDKSKQKDLNVYMVNKTRETLLELEDKVDKEKLVLLTLYNSQRLLEENGKSLKKEARRGLIKCIEKAMELLENRDVSVAELSAEDEQKDTIQMEIINSVELINCIKQKKKISKMDKPDRKDIERLNKIDNKIDLENILQAISMADFGKFIPYGNEVAEGMREQVSWNALVKYRNNHPELNINIADITEDKYPLTEEMEYNLLRGNEYLESMKETIKANLKYIDIDKLLLTAGYNNIELLENDESFRIDEVVDGTIESRNKEDTIRIIQRLVEEIRKNIKDETEIKVSEEEGYSAQDLKKDLRRFSNGKYTLKKDAEDEKQILLENQKNLTQEEVSMLRAMDFSEKDFITLMKNSEQNVIYLIQIGVIGKGEIIGALEISETCSEELFNLILEKNLMDNNSIITLFEEGIINSDIIMKIQDEEFTNRLRKNNIQKVKELYENISNTEKETTPEEMELFNKHALLYKKMNLEEKTEEEISENSYELINSFGDNLNSDVLEGLYQFGLITLEIAVDWGADLNNMLSQGSVKPIDLKNLYEKNIIQIEDIRQVLIKSNLTYEDKLDLIYSTFDGESEEEYKIREDLVGMLGIGEGYKSETIEGRRVRNESKGTKSREFVTDPHARWKLISLLDKDYSKKFLPKGKEIKDGHRVFLLPNQDKVIIERMHERRKGKKVSAYGSATYIMGANDFFKYMNEIIEDNAINRTKLRELSEEDNATRIIHSAAWGKAIKKYFNIDEENEKYTEEEITAIDNAIEGIGKSRKERI